jgi:hypothetical protein
VAADKQKKKKAAAPKPKAKSKAPTTAEAYNKSKACTLWHWHDLPTWLREQMNHPTSFAKKVRLFQRSNGLAPDGKLGPKTLAALKVDAAPVVEVTPEPTEDEAADEGDESELLIAGKGVPCPFPVTQHTPLKSRARRANTTVNCLIIHQSVSSSLRKTADYLRRKGYGVHLMIDSDGSVHQFGDLIESMAHANERNSNAIGIEIINPYVACKGDWQTMIDPSPVAWKGREVSDTPEQIAALDALCAFLTAPNHTWVGSSGVTIKVPPEMPTQKADSPSRGAPGWFDLSVGGIIAHGHRPGKYPASHPKAGQKVKGVHADGRRTLWLLQQRMATGG